MIILKTPVMICLVITINACTISPPYLSPTKHLVTSDKAENKNSVPLRLNDFLESSGSGQIFIDETIKVTLGEKYFSALGQNCTNLFISNLRTNISSEEMDREIERRVACKQASSDSWVFVSEIIEKQSSKNIFTPKK